MPKAIPARETNLLALLPPGETITYRKGGVLYKDQPDRVYYVVSGLVQTYIEGDARLLNLRLLLPGDLCGLSALEGYTGVGSAKALEEAVVLAWEPKVIAETIYDVPTLALAILSAATQESEAHRQHLSEMMAYKVQQRLARAILTYAEAVGERSNDAIVVKRRTHQWWANTVATSREIVTAHINRFAEAGALTMSKARHTSMRVFPAKLEQIAMKVQHAE
jgi:CRP-like cAMP-binding protein